MPLDNYGVVIGDFDHFTRYHSDNFGKFFHGHIFVRAPNTSGGATVLFECAVDVNKPQGNIEYFHVPRLDPDRFLVVPFLPDGQHFLASVPNSGSLDYVRNPLISIPAGCLSIFYLLARGFLKSNHQIWKTNVGQEALDHLEVMVLAKDLAKVFVFGARFDNPGQNPPQGMHDIHYNQGDPLGPFRHLDAIWQDGGVIV